MRERVLITGASGFIGHHIIEEALKNDLDVYVAVRKKSNIAHLKAYNVQFTNLKYSNQKLLAENIRENKYDYIIHAAGLNNASYRGAYDYVNTTITINLAKAAVGQIKKFVFISSLAAVGPLKDLNGIITENTEPHPVSNYGRSKLVAELLLQKVPGLVYTILRPATIYGPGDKQLLPLLNKLIGGKETYIGTQPQKLSYIYAKDVALASVKALYGGNFKTYNISDGNFYDRTELQKIVKDILNLHTAKFHLPVTFVKLLASFKEKVSYLGGKNPEPSPDRLKDIIAPNWACSIETAKQELGFYPLYNLDSGLDKTINWYKANNWI